MLRTGLADHFGWAVAVTVAEDGEVVDRRRLELVEPGLPAAPVHYEGARLGDAGTAELVALVRASIERCAAAALGELPAGVVSVSLRSLPEAFPTDIATLRRSPWEARADAVMYRSVLAAAARARGWEVHFYDVRAVLESVAPDVVARPRSVLGPPWTKDHRVAMAAAIVAGGA